MTTRPLILFDVDGTLVDSNYLHTLAWTRAIRGAGEWAPMNAVHRLIGMGSDALLETLIGRSDEDIADRWKAEYEPLLAEVRPFPFAAQLLADVAAAGVGVVLATSSPAEHLAKLIELLGVEGVVDLTTSADDVERAKPDPAIFLTAMHRGGGEPDTTVVVGDSRWDVEAASSARLACVAVESGGFSAAELRDAGAVAVYRDVAALRADLRAGPLARLLD